MPKCSPLQRPCGRVDEPGHGRGPVGSQDDLGRLDLDLEGQPTVVQPVRRLQPATGLHHRADLRDRGHLRQREPEAVRERTGLQGSAEHQVERAQPTGPGGGLEGLEPHPPVRRGSSRDGPDRRDGVGVLLVVGMAAVAVLQVDPQVLDRLVRELGQQQRPGRGRLRAIRADDRREGLRSVSDQSRQRGLAVAGDQIGGHPVRGHVDRVDRLPGAIVAGVADGQSRVCRRHDLLDGGEICRSQPGLGHST